MKRLVSIFNYRPFTVIGLILCLHTLAYGIGYIIPTSGFASSVLFAALGAFIYPAWVGVFLTVVGVYSVWAWLRNNKRHIAYSSLILAFYWLFAAMCYFVVGAVGQGIGVGLVWSLLSGYTAFAYKQKDETVMHLANEQFRDMLDY